MFMYVCMYVLCVCLSVFPCLFPLMFVCLYLIFIFSPGLIMLLEIMLSIRCGCISFSDHLLLMTLLPLMM